LNDVHTDCQLRTYQSHSLDSTRWQHYRPRDGDIVVSSSYKSGTTWVQMIALRLVVPEIECPRIMEVSPWFESPLAPLEYVTGILERQPHCRVIKTHLPFDGIPYHPEVRYIVVCRDARDVFMSLWNHYRHLVRYPFARNPRHPDRVGPPLPRCPDDVREFWQQWMTRGWFEWEQDGYPFWSSLRHVGTWWEQRHLPNVRMVHYNDLLRDLPGEVRAISAFLDVHVSDDGIARVAADASFESMSRNREQLLSDTATMLQGGASTFLHKGTNGRWTSVLTDSDLDLYRVSASRELNETSQRWLERGGAA
jgi:aryl sulfotransferase